jgi:hypothetical protein
MPWLYLLWISLGCAGFGVVVLWLASARGKYSTARAGLAMVRWGQQQLAESGAHPHIGKSASLVVDDLAKEERCRHRLKKLARMATAHDGGAYVVLAERRIDGLTALYASSDSRDEAQTLADLANEHAIDTQSGFTYTVREHHQPGKRWRPEAQR